MSKRNQIVFNRPEDPKFLKLIKQQAGYKDENTIETKRQKLDYDENNSNDSFGDDDEEQPQVVVIKKGDLTAVEAEEEKKRIEYENEHKQADLNQRVIFKNKTIKTVEEKPADEKKLKNKLSKKNKSSTSKLSFNFDEDSTEES